MTGGEQGRGTGSKVDDTEFGQQTQLQYDALDLFDYGDAPPSLPLLPARAKPLHLCSIMLRMMSLMVAMQLGVLCPEFRGDSWGGERCSLLLLVVVVVDVVVVVVLRKLQILKDGGGTGHQKCGRCSKATRLGQVTLSMWKQRRSLGTAC